MSVNSTVASTRSKDACSSRTPASSVPTSSRIARARPYQWSHASSPVDELDQARAGDPLRDERGVPDHGVRPALVVSEADDRVGTWMDGRIARTSVR